VAPLITSAVELEQFCVEGYCYVIHSERVEYDAAKATCVDGGYTLANIPSPKHQG
jgi:hypothetical protein